MTDERRRWDEKKRMGGTLCKWYIRVKHFHCFTWQEMALLFDLLTMGHLVVWHHAFDYTQDS